jgi:CRISP-associated protein Cas1
MPASVEIEELTEAWERVQENAGCAGADGVTVAKFGHGVQEQLSRLYGDLGSDRYTPMPLLKILVEKQAGSRETRLLLVPAVRDRIAQTAVARRLSRSFEEEFLECSFAYRPGRSVDRAIARIRKCHEMGYRFVVDADIHAFFDCVDHDLLLDRIREREADTGINAVIESWVRATVWDGERLSPLKAGIPQGSPISPLLANLFLQDFDRHLEESGRKLVRYADDFLILAKTAEQAGAALHEAGELLDALKLELNVEKTRVVDFETGFRFLGALFQGEATWIPWKKDKAEKRVVFMARPMPPELRRRLEHAPRPKPRHGSEPRDTKPRKREAGRSAPVAFLYITDQGSVLRKSGDRFLVEKDDEVLLDLPYHKLEHVALFGNVQITSQAMAEALDKGVRISLFSRQGTYRGALTAPRGKNVDLRIAQFEQYRETGRALEVAKSFVTAKIGNARAVIARYRRSRPLTPEMEQDYAALGEAIDTAGKAPDIAAVDGVEGAAARRYFELLMSYNRSGLAWPGRVRHPATDPLNALLSLAYTLLTHELASLAEGLGLDPYLGYLHQPDYGRPSLALDLVEPFRCPAADRFVLTLVNLGRVGADDFQRASSGGCFLSSEAMRTFFRAWEEWMLKDRSAGGCFRQALRNEVEHLAAALRSRTEFPAYRFDADSEAGEEEGWNTSSVTI